MYILKQEIEIGKYKFKSVTDVTIDKSVDELTDTCVIKLPTAFKVKDGNQQLHTEQAIKIGDKVVVKLGYEGHYFGVEFEGYVSKIKPKTPLEIECKDATWLLGKINITKAWNSGTTLQEVLTEVVANTPINLAANIPGLMIDKWICKNANGLQVLEKLNEEFGLSSFLNDENELYCGFSQMINQGEKVNYDLNYNIIKNDLEFKTADERKIKVRYTYIDKENKRNNIEVGDEGGELRTFFTSVVYDEQELKRMALAEIEKLKYDGYSGSIQSFLLPVAKRGMKANLFDANYTNREGSYFIQKVKTSHSISGSRRTVTIGAKL